MTVWASLGSHTANSSVQVLWIVPHPTTVPARHYNGFLLLISWMLWKHRNDTVFSRAPPSHARFWASCWDEVRRAIAEALCTVFCSM
ncbi:hypothetical protein SETIT_3G400700v2 [Setaria italica]|uniref:Uncharacterized protein n=1 Tax=Setaria italica TaxID=4555 RepID=A0A368QNU1_SETIT|nr:hypothetical protein SETIT_3G400700v2 [Setaria italica]